MIKQIHVIECDSTQDVLKEQLSLGHETHQILISCESQTKGYGRHTRQWIALPGTLCFSLTIGPSIVPSFTALEVSLLILKFFESKGQNLKLKWPNDIWNHENQKCAGVLVQNIKDTYLAGIGINLFSTDEIFGGIYLSPFNFEKKKWSREIYEYILHHRYSDMKNLISDWQTHCGHMNVPVQISEGDDNYIGIFLGLGQYGEALLSSNENEMAIFNGTLRPINLDR